MSDLEPGDEFAGHRIEGVAGRGGMGVVYRARQLDLDRMVALKLIAPSLAEDETFRDRFIAESRLAAAIDHPNVIPVYYAGDRDGRLFIAMRFVVGADVRTLVRREGHMDPDRAATVVSQVGQALDAAHARGLVHRDVKPANVLLDGRDHAYLTDFGLTKRMQSQSGATKAGGWVGTLGYVSPEQIRGEHTDARSDVYALGCVLFTMLTGSTPFQRDSDEATLWAHLNDDPPDITQTMPSLPGAFQGVVRRALAKDPDARFQSAGDLGTAALAAAGRAKPGPERVVATGAAAPGGSTVADDETVVSPEHAATAQNTAALEKRRRRARPPVPVLVGSLVAAVVVAAVVVALLASGGDDKSSTTASTPTTPTGPAPVRKAVAGRVTKKVGAGQRPNAIVATRERVWVTSSRSDRVTLLSSKSGVISRNAPKVGSGATAVASADGSVYVAKGSRSLLRYTQSSAKRLGRIALPSGFAVAVVANSSSIWVGSRASGSGTRASATKISPSSGQTEAVVPLPNGLQNLALGDGGLWVIAHDSPTVVRYDTSSADPSRDLPAGNGPYGICVGGGYAWVSNTVDGTVTQISTDSPYRRKRTIKVGREPKGIAYGSGAVWVANSGDGTATRIDAKTGRVVGKPVRIGSSPFAVAVRGHTAWFTLLGDGQVARVTFS